MAVNITSKEFVTENEFPNFSTQKYVLGTQKSHLIKTIFWAQKTNVKTGG